MIPNEQLLSHETTDGEVQNTEERRHRSLELDHIGKLAP